MKILIVEDNQILSKNIGEYLNLKNIENKIASSVELAKIFLVEQKFDIIILDINLPGENGLKFCENLRNSGNDVGIIFLTSRDSKKDIVLGLEAGADDYLVKPFDFSELLARIKTIYRRKNNFVKNEILFKNFVLDIDKKQLKKDGEIIELSSTEYKLLEFFLKNKSKILDRATIYEEVWGEFEKYYFSRNVDIYINKLRKKLGKDIIKTKIGEGYYLD